MCHQYPWAKIDFQHAKISVTGNHIFVVTEVVLKIDFDTQCTDSITTA